MLTKLLEAVNLPNHKPREHAPVQRLTLLKELCFLPDISVAGEIQLSFVVLQRSCAKSRVSNENTPVVGVQTVLYKKRYGFYYYYYLLHVFFNICYMV